MKTVENTFHFLALDLNFNAVSQQTLASFSLDLHHTGLTDGRHFHDWNAIINELLNQHLLVFL